MKLLDKFLDWLFPVNLENWSEEEELWAKEAEEFLKFLNEYEQGAEQGVEPLEQWLKETPKIALYDPENDPEGAKRADDYRQAVETMELCNKSKPSPFVEDPNHIPSKTPIGLSFVQRNIPTTLDEKREAAGLPKLPKKKTKKTTTKKKTAKKKK